MKSARLCKSVSWIEIRATAPIQNDTTTSTISIGMVRAENGFDIALSNHHIISDLRTTFIISTEPDAEHSLFMAKKQVSVSGSSKSNDKQKEIPTVVAVRECGTSKFSQVIRLMYAVSPMMANAIETWIAVLRTNAEDRNLLFSHEANDQSDSDTDGGNHL